MMKLRHGRSGRRWLSESDVWMGRVATPTGFEPAISALTGQYVKPLHYGAAREQIVAFARGSGQRGPPSRTCVRLVGGPSVGASLVGALNMMTNAGNHKEPVSEWSWRQE